MNERSRVGNPATTNPLHPLLPCAGANAATTGAGANAAALGIDAKAKASAGGAIVLTHRNDDGDLTCIRAAMVGQDGIKPDVWYELSADGEFVESEV